MYNVQCKIGKEKHTKGKAEGSTSDGNLQKLDSTWPRHLKHLT